MVEPHVARGDAPQRRGAVEHHVLQPTEWRNVGAPFMFAHHGVHPGTILTANTRAGLLLAGELIYKITRITSDEGMMMKESIHCVKRRCAAK